MDKQTIIRDMKGHVKGGSFINISQIARYMKCSRSRVPELVKELDYLQTGKEKKYFIPDIAERIIQLRRQS